MHRNSYKSKIAMVLISILVICSCAMGCKKPLNPKNEVSKVEESFTASNLGSNEAMNKSSKDLTGESNEKKSESTAVLDNKAEKTNEETKGQTLVDFQKTVNINAGAEKSSNSIAAAISTNSGTSKYTETQVQPNSTAASQTGAQQNQNTNTATNQGQTGEVTTPTSGEATQTGAVTAPTSGEATQTGAATTPTNGGTTQTGGGTTQPSGDTTQPGGGTVTPGNDPKSEPPKSKSALATGDNVVAYASNFLGTPYQFGGTTPDGFDASGLVQYVFDYFDIKVGRTTYEQWKAGTSVSKDELQRGDIVFFGSEQSPHHVGIYVGNNSYIHITQTGDVVKISPFTRSDFVGARRVI